MIIQIQYIPMLKNITSAMKGQSIECKIWDLGRLKIVSPGAIEVDPEIKQIEVWIQVQSFFSSIT